MSGSLILHGPTLMPAVSCLWVRLVSVALAFSVFSANGVFLVVLSFDQISCDRCDPRILWFLLDPIFVKSICSLLGLYFLVRSVYDGSWSKLCNALPPLKFRTSFTAMCLLLQVPFDLPTFLKVLN